MPRPDEIPGSVDEWMNRARSDLALAAVDPPTDTLLEDLCFHTQQAAEKAIKAVFLHHGYGFQYIHDLRRLCADLESNGIGVPDAIKPAVALTNYAHISRYPNFDETVTEAEYREAVELATAVVRWAESVTGV